MKPKIRNSLQIATVFARLSASFGTSSSVVLVLRRRGAGAWAWIGQRCRPITGTTVESTVRSLIRWQNRPGQH